MATNRMAVGNVAAIYDIHGNLPALEAVLTAIAPAQVDLILVGGDVAAGPMPRETVDRLMALGERAHFIRGNSDREVVARYDRAGHFEEGMTADDGDDEVERITTWTADRLSRDQRDFLATFDEHAEFDILGLGTTLFCHGSPRSDEEIITSVTPESRLRTLLNDVAQEAVVCGHTHMQFDRNVIGKHLINAGSVGMPYEGQPGAYWVLLGPGVTFQRTTYDLDRAAEQIRATNYPGAEEFVRENVLASPTTSEVTAIFEKMATERLASDEAP